MREYTPLLMLLGFVVVNAIIVMGLSHLVSPQRPTAIKGAAYESMIPWATALRRPGLSGLIEMAVFILILAVGFGYIWKRGALEWE